jgi:alkaline phosphatase
MGTTSVGLTETASADSLVTDSAAAGSALATGCKTVNGVLGMSADGQEKLGPTLARQAARRGMKVGIVSTVSLDHATPASFYAHQPRRSDYYEIAMQLPTSGFDYFAGGGLQGRHPEYRQGRADPYDAIREAGYVLVRNRDQLAKADPAAKVCFFTDELDFNAAMGYAIDRSPGSPDLAELTRIGIERLAGPGGFFLVVEGGRIDWACHENDAATTAREVIDFDRAVAVALDFYRRHPGETLLIVTADHETGGLGLGNSRLGYRIKPDVLLAQKISGRAFARTIDRFRACCTIILEPNRWIPI